MENKAAITISIISLVFSILSLSHDFLVKEYGLIIGNIDYDIRPSDKLAIQNDIEGLSIAPIIDISNNGTVPIRIDKIKAFIKFNNSQHIFNTLTTISLPINGIHKNLIWFNEKYTDIDRLNKDSLSSNIIRDLTSSYHNRYQSDNEVKFSEPIFLSNELYEDLCNSLRNQIEWMKPDDEYYLLIMLWINSNDKEPNTKYLYKFGLNEFQLKILSDYQCDGLKTPRKIPGNVATTYRAYPNLEYTDDFEKVSTVYQSYKSLSVKTN